MQHVHILQSFLQAYNKHTEQYGPESTYIYTQLWSELLATLVNMIKGGSENNLHY